jgi:cytochrome c peroxidase
MLRAASGGSAALVAACLALSDPAPAAELTPIETLGKSIFNDPALSVNGDQPCAFCHSPGMGFTSPHAWVNEGGAVVPGSVPGRYGNRRPPSIAYAATAPLLHHKFEEGDGGEKELLFVGGLFLDGRATGHKLGLPLADQAQAPFLNPLEMALPHAACVVARVCNPAEPERYPVGLTEVWGPGTCDIALDPGLIGQCSDPDARIEIADEAVAEAVEAAFDRIALAIAAWEASSEVNPYSSRFDRWLRGEVEFTAEERLGFEVFRDVERGKCAECHVLTRGPNNEPPAFTDWTYDNLGVPRNPANPFYVQTDANPDGADWVDPGLAGFLSGDGIYDMLAPGQLGKQQVPTLRNVDRRLRPEVPKAFMHNGYFKTLEGVVKFYNTRDVWPRCESDLVTEAEALALRCWPAPEVAANVNTDELGDLGLSEAEEAALVAFMRTLSDED